MRSLNTYDTTTLSRLPLFPDPSTSTKSSCTLPGKTGTLVLPQFLVDRRSSRMDLINYYLVFVRTDEHTPEHAPEPRPSAANCKVRLELVARGARDRFYAHTEFQSAVARAHFRQFLCSRFKERAGDSLRNQSPSYGDAKQ